VTDTNKTVALVKINLVETNMGTSKDLKDSCICDWSYGDDLLQSSTTSRK
jgi:hypothetical protein